MWRGPVVGRMLRILRVVSLCELLRIRRTGCSLLRVVALMQWPRRMLSRTEVELGHESEAYERWLCKLTKHVELQHWSEREKLLHFELHLVGEAA